MKISRLWIRFVCFVLCLTVLIPCVSAMAETTKVACYLLRLRAAPSVKSTVLDAYPRGTIVTILKKGTDWTKVKVRGKVGYMQTNLLAYGRGNGNNNGNNGSGTTMYVMAGIRLNLREEPNSYCDIIASFRGGTKVTVLRKGKYWSYVLVKGLYGYMGNDYLVDSK